MTEEDYINATNLAKVRATIAVVDQLFRSEDIVDDLTIAQAALRRIEARLEALFDDLD